MKSKIIYGAVALVLLILVWISFKQRNEIKELKKISLKYEKLTHSFKILNESYSTNLKEYRRIKAALDLNKSHLDSLILQMNNANKVSEAELNAAKLELESAIMAIDTSSFTFAPIINLDSLLNK